MSAPGTQDNSHSYAVGLGVSQRPGSFILVGNDGTGMGAPNMHPDRLHPHAVALRAQLASARAERAALQDEHDRLDAAVRVAACRAAELELQLAPPRLECEADCACWQALECGNAPLRELSYHELTEWMAALVGPLMGAAAHTRMYHHERATKPESPLNAGYIGFARALDAFGFTPEYYAHLQDAVRKLTPEELISSFGAWGPFCPLVWRKGEEAPARLLDHP